MSSAEKQRKKIKGTTRTLFEKIRDTKGIFNARMGTMKDRNSKDLTEPEEIKKRQQEYMGELYKMTQITTKMWSLTYSQIPWCVKSSGPQETLP